MWERKYKLGFGTVEGVDTVGPRPEYLSVIETDGVILFFFVQMVSHAGVRTSGPPRWQMPLPSTAFALLTHP